MTNPYNEKKLEILKEFTYKVHKNRKLQAKSVTRHVMISPSLSGLSSQARPRLTPVAGHPAFARRPANDISDASATPSPSPPPSVTSSTGDKSLNNCKMTNFSIAAIMNNRRNAEEFEENEIESKRRKIIVESMPNNNLGNFFFTKLDFLKHLTSQTIYKFTNYFFIITLT